MVAEWINTKKPPVALVSLSPVGVHELYHIKSYYTKRKTFITIAIKENCLLTDSLLGTFVGQLNWTYTVVPNGLVKFKLCVY